MRPIPVTIVEDSPWGPVVQALAIIFGAAFAVALAMKLAIIALKAGAIILGLYWAWKLVARLAA